MKPTIEDLFQIKRAERPSPEFWIRFEQDLRTKQLAAIIEKRPWWISLRLPQFARQVVRFQVPVGAAAVLALGFVVVREYRSSDSLGFVPGVIVTAQNVPAMGESVVVGQLPRVDVSDFVETVVAMEATTPTAVAAKGEQHDGQTHPVSVAASSEPTSSESLMSMIPWAAPRADGEAVNPGPALPIGELPQVHFASAMASDSYHDFEGQVEWEPLMVSSPQTVVGEMTTAPGGVGAVTPREVRRNRILTNLVVADVGSTDGEPSRIGRIREMLVSSLDDDRLYDSVRRVGMGGDRFTVKF